MITSAALRSMRGALDWSMRDLAAAAQVSLATVLKAEHAGSITAATERRLRMAFAAQGVTARLKDGVAMVRIGPAPQGLKASLLQEIGGLPYVTVRPRANGTHRVQFEVPKRLRPVGWPACRPLPFSVPRRGNLDDRAEVKAIRQDATALMDQLCRHLPVGGPLEPQKRKSAPTQPKHAVGRQRS